MAGKEDWVRGELHASKREIVAGVNTDVILSGARRNVIVAGMGATRMERKNRRPVEVTRGHA
jgi:hypothetical protein